MEHGGDHGALTWEEYGLLLRYRELDQARRRASGGWWRTSPCWTGC